MKECAKCHVTKPFDKFHANKRMQSGYASYCKECTTIAMREWRRKHPDKAQAARKRDRQKETFKTWEKQYRKSHKRQEYLRQRREKNRNAIAAKAAAYYQRTKEARDAYNTQWRHANPEAWSSIHARWVALHKSAPVNDLTDAQWQEIKAAFRFRCAYCGKKKPLTRDHITPLSQGGSHTASNIVPACRSCNSAKHTGPPPVPVQPVLLTVADATPRCTPPLTPPAPCATARPPRPLTG